MFKIPYNVHKLETRGIIEDKPRVAVIDYCKTDFEFMLLHHDRYFRNQTFISCFRVHH